MWLDIEIRGFRTENIRLPEVYGHTGTWHFVFVNKRIQTWKRACFCPNFYISKLKAEIKYPHCKWIYIWQMQIWRAHCDVFNFLLVGVGHCLKMAVYVLSSKRQNLHIRNTPQILTLCTKQVFSLRDLKRIYSKFQFNSHWKQMLVT